MTTGAQGEPGRMKDGKRNREGRVVRGSRENVCRSLLRTVNKGCGTRETGNICFCTSQAVNRQTQQIVRSLRNSEIIINNNNNNNNNTNNFIYPTEMDQKVQR